MHTYAVHFVFAGLVSYFKETNKSFIFKVLNLNLLPRYLFSGLHVLDFAWVPRLVRFCCQCLFSHFNKKGRHLVRIAQVWVSCFHLLYHSLNENWVRQLGEVALQFEYTVSFYECIPGRPII